VLFPPDTPEREIIPSSPLSASSYKDEAVCDQNKCGEENSGDSEEFGGECDDDNDDDAGSDGEGEGVCAQDTGPNASAKDWFARVYPNLTPAARKQLGMIEFIQQPGEIVFIPFGWWHVVINIDVTIGVTQNYLCASSFPEIFERFREATPEGAASWWESLPVPMREVCKVMMTDEVDKT
jgi:hypothetical protein